MMKEKTRDDLGLALTMLDSDRLRQWAEKLDTYGANISHWGDQRFVSEQLRAVAGRIEATVREVGTLRELAGMVESTKKPSARLRDYLRDVADCRHSDRSDEGGGLVCIACVEAAIDVLGQNAKDACALKTVRGNR